MAFMFVKAIETATPFIRPIHFITRAFESDIVIPGAATLFFVNDEGWALTCGHVADEIGAVDTVNNRYTSYRTEVAGLRNANKNARRGVQRRHGLTPHTTAQMKVRFMGCGVGELQIEFLRETEIDIALLKFSPAPRCSMYPTFAKDGGELKQGKTLCRLGYPFPEFTNFKYNARADEIEWTDQGQDVTPRFPIDGMVTRHLVDASGSINGFEMSTPGLRGQSGGPAFDTEGKVWGMQALTHHLDLDFDVDQAVLRGGRTERRRNSAFLHVGNCIHVESLKSAMRKHSVPFCEA